jgi:hypothetical protein
MSIQNDLIGTRQALRIHPMVLSRWLVPSIIVLMLGSVAVFGAVWPLWIDEIFTARVAGLGDPSRIIGALMNGVDGSPPLLALVTSLFVRMIPLDPELVLRLPALMAFGGFLLGVVRLFRSRMSAGTLATCVLLAGLLRLDTGFTARPYAFALCFSIWFIVWLFDAHASGKLRSWLLASAFLALAIASQYYCVFLFVPMAVLIGTRLLAERKIDPKVTLTVISTGAVLALHLPIILILRTWTKHYWSKPGLDHIFQLETLLLAVALSIAAIGMVMSTDIRRIVRNEVTAERLFLLTLAALPMIVVPIIRLTTNAFVDRYLTFSVIGLVGVIGWMLDLPQVQVWLKRVTIAGFVGAVLVQCVAAVQPRVWLPRYEAALDACRALGVVVVCPSTCVVTEASHYNKANTGFLAYPLDQEAEIIGAKSDTSFRIMKANGEAGYMQTVDLKALLAKGDVFAILTDERLTYEKWVQDEAVAAGYRLREVAAFPGVRKEDGRSIKVMMASRDAVSVQE